jgi:hypothetical protein
VFTLVVSLFVLAAAITAVLALTVGVSDKPATERPHRRREQPAPVAWAGPSPQPATVAGPPAERALSPAREPPAAGARRVTVELLSPWRRLRSAVLLVVLVVGVGSAVALVLAAALALLGLSLRDAVT